MDLRQTIAHEGEQAKAYNALANAFEQKRKDLLVLGLSNPNMWTQREAAIMISKLVDQDTTNELIIILGRKDLWIKITDGGRSVAMQDAFVSAFKVGLKTKLDFDVSATDLYDLNTRSQLINRLKQK